jgi:hypothetical protein
MTCAACGGDGQIEYGAYRGDSGTATRECRLCGGRPSGPLERLGEAAAQAGASMEQMAQALTLYDSESGRRRVAMTVAPTMRSVVGNVRDYEQRKRALQTARETVERKQREQTGPLTLPDTGQMNGDEIMNRLIRKAMKERR